MTTDPIGFKTATDSFTLGISTDEFERRFGKGEGDGKFYEHYFADGFMFNIGPDGKVSRFIFFFQTPFWDKRFTPCDVKTDQGIGAGSKRVHVYAAYGKPLKDLPEFLDHVPASQQATNRRWMQYPWGEVKFTDDVVTEISIAPNRN